MSTGVVRRGTPPASGGGNQAPLRTNSYGEVVQVPAMLQWVMDGRVYAASDADENDLLLGTTSFAATTPTLLLRVPTGTTAIPLWIDAAESTTAAGGDIQYYLSFDRVDRYSSGGTSETITHMRTDRPRAPLSTVYSLATASAATDARSLWSAGDVPTTAGTGTAVTTGALLVHLVAFKNFIPPMLVGPAALLFHAWSGTTAPSLIWSLGFAEFITSEVN